MIPLIGYSLNLTSKITSEKSLNDTTVLALILAEHLKLSIENPLLKQQIDNYKMLNENCEKQDSLHLEEIIIYKEELSNALENIKKLKSSLKKTIIGSSIGGVLLFILGILL